LPPPAITANVQSGQQPIQSDTDAVNAQRTVAIRAVGPWWRRLFSFVGPGYLVAVGYMDPGNWATDLAGGSSFGYSLLWIVGLSSLMAMLLQVLAARLGIVTGLDLAQCCREHSSKRSSVLQWLLCEVAICACDLAEVLGTAIALKLLFDIPLSYGVVLTVLDVLVVLWLMKRGVRYLEAFIISLLAIVFVCFGINMLLAQPQWHDVFAGFIPSNDIVTQPGMLYIAIGIIGATVMPHNLYLHSSTVQTRRFDTSQAGKKVALRFASIDIVMALCLALLVNAAILITSAAIFHTSGHVEVAGLQDAYRLLGPLTGTAIASILFGVALLASGLSSSVTATLAGQIVMDGYVRLKLPPWARRLLTRSLAIAPAFFVTLADQENGITKLLLLSQVILSLQLPFAVYPLIRFTSSKKVMGDFANSAVTVYLAWACMVIIVCLNAFLIVKEFNVDSINPAVLGDASAAGLNI
jgi:manganese transport protein